MIQGELSHLEQQPNFTLDTNMQTDLGKTSTMQEKDEPVLFTYMPRTEINIDVQTRPFSAFRTGFHRFQSTHLNLEIESA